MIDRSTDDGNAGEHPNYDPQVASVGELGTGLFVAAHHRPWNFSLCPFAHSARAGVLQASGGLNPNYADAQAREVRIFNFNRCREQKLFLLLFFFY